MKAVASARLMARDDKGLARQTVASPREDGPVAHVRSLQLH